MEEWIRIESFLLVVDTEVNICLPKRDSVFGKDMEEVHAWQDSWLLEGDSSSLWEIVFEESIETNIFAPVKDVLELVLQKKIIQLVYHHEGNNLDWYFEGRLQNTGPDWPYD